MTRKADRSETVAHLNDNYARHEFRQGGSWHSEPTPDDRCVWRVDGHSPYCGITRTDHANVLTARRGGTWQWPVPAPITGDGLRAALERLLAEPTTDIRTLNARTLFEKAKRSATQEVTISAQALRLLLPAIETEAVNLVVAAALSQPVPEPGLDVDATPEYDHHWRPAGSRNAGPALTSRPPCPICHSTDIEHAPTCPHPSSLSARLTSPEPTPPAPEPK